MGVARLAPGGRIGGRGSGGDQDFDLAFPEVPHDLIAVPRFDAVSEVAAFYTNDCEHPRTRAP